MKFIGYIQNGVLTFPAIQYQLRTRFVATMKNGSRVEETLVRKGEPGTYEQLKYEFGVVIAMLYVYCEENGVDVMGCAPTREMCKEILYNACCERDDDGRLITLSIMDKKQRSEFIDRTQDWMASQLGVYVPPADKNWRNNGQTKS